MSERVWAGHARLADYLPVLELIASSYPATWLSISELHEEAGAPEDAKDALMRYLEKPGGSPEQSRAWEQLTKLCRETGDSLGEVHALIEISQLADTSLNRMSAAANRFNSLLSSGELRLDTAEKQVMAKKLATAMEGRIADGDATDCSRLAWLFLHLHDETGARKYAETGLSLDWDNRYCRGLMESLDQQSS